jgi:hypothetical protein
MIPLESRAPSVLMMDLMLEALRVSDEKLNAIAMELLTRFGEQTVRRLALAAAYTKNKPSHRIRALRAIRRIGIVTDPGSNLDILGLMFDKNEAVRKEADELIEALRLRRLAETVEEKSASGLLGLSRRKW